MRQKHLQMNYLMLLQPHNSRGRINLISIIPTEALKVILRNIPIFLPKVLSCLVATTNLNIWLKLEFKDFFQIAEFTELI